MSISINYYTVYGVKHPWIEDFDEVYADSDCPTIIADVMDGQYVIFGKIMFDSGNVNDGDTPDKPFVEIDQDALPELEAQYKKEFVTKFPQFASLVDVPFKLMTFVHYS